MKNTDKDYDKVRRSLIAKLSKYKIMRGSTVKRPSEVADDLLTYV